MNYLITLADNGYIVEYDDGLFLSVYEGEEVSNNMCQDLLGELIDKINDGVASKFSVNIEIKPLPDAGDKFRRNG